MTTLDIFPPATAPRGKGPANFRSFVGQRVEKRLNALPCRCQVISQFTVYKPVTSVHGLDEGLLDTVQRSRQFVPALAVFHTLDQALCLLDLCANGRDCLVLFADFLDASGTRGDLIGPVALSALGRQRAW